MSIVSDSFPLHVVQHNRQNLARKMQSRDSYRTENVEYREQCKKIAESNKELLKNSLKMENSSYLTATQQKVHLNQTNPSLMSVN